LASSRAPLPGFTPTSRWLHQWIYYLAAGFMFAAAVSRAVLIFQDEPLLGRVIFLLAAWLLAFLADTLLSRRLPQITITCLVIEAMLILYLVLISEQDFFAFLFPLLHMQAMLKYQARSVAILIAITGLLSFLALFGQVGGLQALALALIYSAFGALMAAYIWSTRQAQVVRVQQQALVEDLQQANQRLEFHSHQQERLAAGRERQRLARELHDSVTQTIFSMTLTTQSALLLLEADPPKVAAQLDRLDQLSQSAMAEMQVLISRLALDHVNAEGFVSALRRHLDERLALDNLSVTLEVEGSQQLDPRAEAALFRIAQEALNNIIKHAQVSQASVRLHLSDPCWMEVEDLGVGFNPKQDPHESAFGMAGMRERAAGIGWNLSVDSAIGKGTRIRVEKQPQESE
jgi:signal transduction histidine kinase